MLSAFRRNEAVERGIVPALGLNAPSGAQCFPMWSATDHRILLAIVLMHLLALNAFRPDAESDSTIGRESQCTFWRSVPSDRIPRIRGDGLLLVSMHLLVLDDYRLTSPQAAPQRRLFDGNRHGRFTRPDSSANTMSIRPCSCRIPPLNGHASPTVHAPLSAPVFTGPRRQASCCRNFPSIRACTVAPSQITSKRAQIMFPRI